MTRQLDDATATADASSLRASLNAALDAAADRPLPELLRDLATLIREALGCTHVTLTLRDSAGHAEVFPAAHQYDQDVRDDEVLEGVESITVPILLRGVEAGEVHLVGSHDDAAFTADEHRRVVAISDVVSTVIEKARTAEANRHREEWYAGGVEVAKEIVAGRVADPLQLVVHRVAAIARADSVSILQLGATENSYVIVATNGTDNDLWVGREITVPDAVTSRVMATGRPMMARERHLNRVEMPVDVRARIDVDSVAVVPLMGSGAQQGVIIIGRHPGGAEISSAEMGMATMFAGTVALALELAESQTHRDELALVEERDRIARDLHDHVIQRLYAIGLSMQSFAGTLDEPDEQRLMTSVDDIDDTIKQIRSTIFRLTTPLISSRGSLRARAEALLDELSPALGFRPRLVSNGPVDFGVDEAIIDDCDAVLREAVTNIARHAHATEAEIAITVSSAQLRLEIRDNGRGLGDTSRRSGLANLRARAENHDGFMQVRSPTEAGTWLLWSIPLPDTR